MQGLSCFPPGILPPPSRNPPPAEPGPEHEPWADRGTPCGVVKPDQPRGEVRFASAMPCLHLRWGPPDRCPAQLWFTIWRLIFALSTDMSLSSSIQQCAREGHACNQGMQAWLAPHAPAADVALCGCLQALDLSDNTGLNSTLPPAWGRLAEPEVRTECSSCVCLKSVSRRLG